MKLHEIAIPRPPRTRDAEGKFLPLEGDQFDKGTYISWYWMLHRCLDQKCHKYPRYGGRGIKVCDRWLELAAFIADMGTRPKGTTIDRIDNNGNYEPGNCQWASPTQQANNRHNMRELTYLGNTKTLAEWEAETGIKASALASRYKRGWPVERIFGQPFRKSPEVRAVFEKAIEANQ